MNVHIAGAAVAHDRHRLFLTLRIARANEYDEPSVQQVVPEGGRVQPLTIRSLITLPIAVAAAPPVRATATMAARAPPDAITGRAAPKAPTLTSVPNTTAEHLKHHPE